MLVIVTRLFGLTGSLVDQNGDGLDDFIENECPYGKADEVCSGAGAAHQRSLVTIAASKILRLIVLRVPPRLVSLRWRGACASGRKKVLSTRDENASAAGLAPYSLVGRATLCPVVVAGVELAVINP